MPIHLCRLLLLAIAVALTACAGVPFDYPKQASRHLPTDPDTALGKLAIEWRQEHGEKSGFIGLANGVDALGARLRAMELAQSSIDAQYFIVKKDRAGALFAGKMLRAADRGVRVRLLVDDIFSPGVDQPFALLDSHPNVEVRLFNPVARQGFKYLNYMTDFKRANRRMHNKSFTVDNAISIVGGRNIGEEYFELKQDVKFDDYEVLTMGRVVDEISAGFDAYWNSALSVPMAALGVQTEPADLNRWRDYIRERTEGSENGIYAAAVNSSLLRDLREGLIQPVLAPAVMITDPPEKLERDVGDLDHAELAMAISNRFRAAQREILIITPYFIPQERGTSLLTDILKRGVRVVVVTNSLASTNHVAVHSGYARYRRQLLEAGAEFWEIKATRPDDESNAWGYKPSRVTLHSKATVIDRETVFIGSLNFDPRSVLINSEMGLFIDSAVTGEALRQAIYEDLQRVAYQVQLDDDGNLRWVYHYGEQPETVHREPQASWWRRFQVGVYGLLPIESQL